MPTLYVTEPGATLRMQGESFIVTVDRERGGEPGSARRRETLIEVEPHRLELVVLVGRCHVTSDAMHACLDQGITVAYMNWRGRLRGRTVPEIPRSGDLRLLQYRTHAVPEVRLRLARSAVVAKIRGAIEVLRGMQSNEAGNEAVAGGIRDLKTLPERIASCTDVEILRGLEGLAARTYFEALRAGFKAEITFNGRRSRPPPDPANALLSFGYVLVANLLAGMLEARGLDPAIGFYHQVRPGRPSLALDLLEEFRHPLVDRFVLRVCNLRILQPLHFEPDPERPEGLHLTRDGIRRFFDEWERHLQRPLREGGGDSSRLPARKVFERQVERLVADLRGGTAYRAFLSGEGPWGTTTPPGT